jgi:multidrug resistance protein, MATE family
MPHPSKELEKTDSWRSHITKTILLAWPVCLSNVGNVMVGVVDLAMVGGIIESQTGYTATTAQAAASLANSFYFLVLVFGMGVSYGVTPFVAEADSSGNIQEKTHLLSHALVVNIIVNTLLFILLLVISPILYHLNQPADVVRLAIPFLNVMMLGMIPLAVFSALKQFAEGLSFTRFAMYVSVFSNALNVLLNYILIFGKWGFAPMGMQGSCWASFITRVMMALLMFLYIFYHKKYKCYKEAFLFKKIELVRMKKIVKVGAASGLQWLFEVGAFAFALVMIGWIGKKEQAAHQIALQLAALTYIVASGISAAASVRVGNQLGKNNQRNLKKAAAAAFILATAIQLVFATLFVLFRFVLPTLFNHEQEVQKMVASLLLIAALFQISDGIQVVGLGVLRGIKDSTIPTLLTFITYWVIGLPACYLLAFQFNLGIQGIWYGLTLALTLAASLLYYRFQQISQKV